MRTEEVLHVISSKPLFRALAAHLLLASVTLAGCSFPTSEFNLNGSVPVDVPDARVQDVPATTDVPGLDALDVPVADVPATDQPVADATDATAPDAPDVLSSDANDAGSADDAGDVPADDASDAGADAASDVPPTCPTGQAYCVDGCVDTETSATHCGRCGNQCAAANATGVCAAGACSFTCTPGFADCNGVASDGCEANLATVATCGSCMSRCDSTNGTPACTAGACAITCAMGFGNCDGSAANGCETNLQTDVTHCGTCPTACANTHGAPSCAAGACAIACAAGFGNCDATAANGCEVNTATDPANCGACGTRCTAAQSCVAGTCTTVCPYTTCSGACVDLATSVANCGACGRVCTALNGTARCAASACGIASCNAGFADCDTTVAGCETSTTANVANCGACNRRCAFANAAASCAAGACVLGACNAGFGNCDGNAANGCETNLLTDINNCGACSTRCSPPNGAPTCTAGACGLGACTTGFANCDAAAANGCEVNTTLDPANCGACGTLCRNYVYGGSSACAASVCVPTCNAGYANCDGNATNGCEASLNSNLNCGSCGRACALSCGAGGTCTGVAPGSYLQTRYLFPGPAFVDACAAVGHTTYLPNLDDGSVRVPLPFAMRSWNVTVPINTQINIASNGWLSFDPTARQDYYAMIPDTAGPNWVVAPYFTDLYTSATGVCVATIGASPSRRFVVEWLDAVFLSDRTRHLTFEAILNESGLVEFYYSTMDPPPAQQNVTIGLENQTGAAGVVVCNPANACAVGTGSRLGYLVQ